MGWLNDIEHNHGLNVRLTREDIDRLISEARKMERVREQVKRRMERDEYDQIIDDIHEIIEDK